MVINKTAVVISGNLRTFLMPSRESTSKKLYDLFIENIINHNDADIFIFTDTNDFYYNGVQYYTNDRRIEILNDNACRIHDKIDFLDNNLARDIINCELSKIPNVKIIEIENPFNPKNDPKFNLLINSNVGGSSPTLLIHQFRKLKSVYNLLKNYEKQNDIFYDTILKWRFDIAAINILDLKSYNYHHNDIYVAGIHPPIIYDWHALGNRRGMDICLSIYDYLGTFLNEGQIFTCNKCSKINQNNICPIHNNCCSEITLAPEYHLYKALAQNNIKYADSGYPGFPYRYREIWSNAKVENILNNLNIDATLVNYIPNNCISETSYKAK